LVQLWDIDPEHARQQLRALRAAPPGLAATPGRRKEAVPLAA
jgi:hypothetical protein